jgi:hypothetical protein
MFKMNKKILLASTIVSILLLSSVVVVSKPLEFPGHKKFNGDLIERLISHLTEILERIQGKSGRTPPGLARIIERLDEEPLKCIDPPEECEDEPPEGCEEEPEEENGCEEPEEEPECDEFEGCSQGFWKNHPCVWYCYTPGQLLKDVFEFPEELEDLGDNTLLEALKFKGGKGIEGKARNLLRQAVAALLNAEHPDVLYPLSEAEIIERVNDSLASLDEDAMGEVKDTLDKYNNYGSGLCGCHDDCDED